MELNHHPALLWVVVNRKHVGIDESSNFRSAWLRFLLHQPWALCLPAPRVSEQLARVHEVKECLALWDGRMKVWMETNWKPSLRRNSSSRGVQGWGSIMKQEAVKPTNIKRVRGCSCNRCTSTGLLILWVEANRNNIDERCCCCTVEKCCGSSVPTEVLQSLVLQQNKRREGSKRAWTQHRKLRRIYIKINIEKNIQRRIILPLFLWLWCRLFKCDIVQLTACCYGEMMEAFLRRNAQIRTKGFFVWLSLPLLSHPESILIFFWSSSCHRRWSYRWSSFCLKSVAHWHTYSHKQWQQLKKRK